MTTIGLYDSGLGGLSVMRAVRQMLPNHDLLYLADEAFCPYGPRPVEEVRQRAVVCSRWLVQQGVGMIVVACNTATSAALECLRDVFDLPIVGMEPGIKPAVAATRTGRIRVLATDGTLEGQRLASLIRRFAGNTEIQLLPCPELVTCVETADLTSPETRYLVARCLAQTETTSFDTLVLGCTHFPFLKPIMADLIGPAITIIDTGPAVARQVARVAQMHNLTPHSGHIHCATTGAPHTVAPVIAHMWGEILPVFQAVLPTDPNP